MSIHGIRDVSGLIDISKKKDRHSQKEPSHPNANMFQDPAHTAPYRIVRIFRTVLLEGALSR